MGVNAIEEIDIRMQANSIGWKAMSAFFININELPQTTLRPNRIRNDFNSMGFSSIGLNDSCEYLQDQNSKTPFSSVNTIG